MELALLVQDVQIPKCRSTKADGEDMFQKASPNFSG